MATACVILIYNVIHIYMEVVLFQELPTGRLTKSNWHIKVTRLAQYNQINNETTF